jgi:hypothetical protein
MILLNDVFEVFDLTDLDASIVFTVVTFDRRRVGAPLVNRDLLRCAAVPDRLAKKPQSGFAILSGGQQEVTVAPALSTARYKYFQAPFTLT